MMMFKARSPVFFILLERAPGNSIFGTSGYTNLLFLPASSTDAGKNQPGWATRAARAQAFWPFAFWGSQRDPRRGDSVRHAAQRELIPNHQFLRVDHPKEQIDINNHLPVST